MAKGTAGAFLKKKLPLAVYLFDCRRGHRCKSCKLVHFQTPTHKISKALFSFPTVHVTKKMERDSIFLRAAVDVILQMLPGCVTPAGEMDTAQGLCIYY